MDSDFILKASNKMKPQNSGVVVTTQTKSYSTRGHRSIFGDVEYVGVVNETIELDCTVNKSRVV